MLFPSVGGYMLKNTEAIIGFILVTPSDFAKIKMYYIIKNGVTYQSHSGVGIHIANPTTQLECEIVG